MLLLGDRFLMKHDYRRVLLADVNDLLDEDGRPIGEIRASESVRHAVKTVYAMCPYSGSRSRTPRLINSSAIDQVISNWNKSLGLMEYVRMGCIAESSHSPPLIELARTSAVALAVPAYLLYSEPCRLPSGSIPVFIAAAHKMNAGLFGLCKNRLLSQVALGNKYKDVTDSSAALYLYAEESGSLLSRTGVEACAGPPSLIVEALDLLVDGSCRSKRDVQAAEKLLGNRESLLNYAYAVIDITLWLNVFAICCQNVVENLHSRIERVNSLFNSEFIDRAYSAANGYRLEGFSDPTISGIFQFPEAVQVQYAIGAANLLCYPDPHRVSAMLGSEIQDTLYGGVDSLTQSFITSMQNRLPNEDARFLAEGIFRARVLEREGVQIFFDLQSKLHKALNWTPPSPKDTPRILASVFGALPSDYILKVFGSGFELL
jgi:hypothetical protein